MLIPSAKSRSAFHKHLLIPASSCTIKIKEAVFLCSLFFLIIYFIILSFAANVRDVCVYPLLLQTIECKKFFLLKASSFRFDLKIHPLSCPWMPERKAEGTQRNIFHMHLPGQCRRFLSGIFIVT